MGKIEGSLEARRAWQRKGLAEIRNVKKKKKNPKDKQTTTAFEWSSVDVHVNSLHCHLCGLLSKFHIALNIYVQCIYLVWSRCSGLRGEGRDKRHLYYTWFYNRDWFKKINSRWNRLLRWGGPEWGRRAHWVRKQLVQKSRAEKRPTPGLMCSLGYGGFQRDPFSLQAAELICSCSWPAFSPLP